MKILTRYLLKSLLAPMFYCMMGFCLLFVISDLFSNVSEFFENKASLRDVLHYYSLILPTHFIYLMPVCLLLAMLYSLSRLTRHSEIIAMRAGGVSIYRIVMPYIGVGLATTFLVAVVNEKIAPDAAYRAEKFLDYQKTGKNDAVYLTTSMALKVRNHVWQVQQLDTRDYTMHNLELIVQRKDGSDEVKYQAEKARWLDGHWWFEDIRIQSYKENGDLAGPPDIVLLKEMRDLFETPKTFMAEIKDIQNLSAREIRHYLRTKKGISENNRDRLKVDMHSRLAAPFTCLIVTLIGVPIGAHTGRRGAFAGIVTAVVLFFVFYILQLIGQALGKNGHISPFLGGWLATLIFTAVSPLFIHRMK